MSNTLLLQINANGSWIHVADFPAAHRDQLKAAIVQLSALFSGMAFLRIATAENLALEHLLPDPSGALVWHLSALGCTPACIRA